MNIKFLLIFLIFSIIVLLFIQNKQNVIFRSISEFSLFKLNQFFFSKFKNFVIKFLNISYKKTTHFFFADTNLINSFDLFLFGKNDQFMRKTTGNEYSGYLQNLNVFSSLSFHEKIAYRTNYFISLLQKRQRFRSFTFIKMQKFSLNRKNSSYFIRKSSIKLAAVLLEKRKVLFNTRGYISDFILINTVFFLIFKILNFWIVSSFKKILSFLSLFFYNRFFFIKQFSKKSNSKNKNENFLYKKLLFLNLSFNKFFLNNEIVYYLKKLLTNFILKNQNQFPFCGLILLILDKYFFKNFYIIFNSLCFVSIFFSYFVSFTLNYFINIVLSLLSFFLNNFFKYVICNNFLYKNFKQSFIFFYFNITKNWSFNLFLIIFNFINYLYFKKFILNFIKNTNKSLINLFVVIFSIRKDLKKRFLKLSLQIFRDKLLNLKLLFDKSSYNIINNKLGFYKENLPNVTNVFYRKIFKFYNLDVNSFFRTNFFEFYFKNIVFLNSSLNYLKFNSLNHIKYSLIKKKQRKIIFKCVPYSSLNLKKNKKNLKMKLSNNRKIKLKLGNFVQNRKKIYISIERNFKTLLYTSHKFSKFSLSFFNFFKFKNLLFLLGSNENKINFSLSKFTFNKKFIFRRLKFNKLNSKKIRYSNKSNLFKFRRYLTRQKQLRKIYFIKRFFKLNIYKFFNSFINYNIFSFFQQTFDLINFKKLLSFNHKSYILRKALWRDDFIDYSFFHKFFVSKRDRFWNNKIINNENFFSKISAWDKNFLLNQILYQFFDKKDSILFQTSKYQKINKFNNALLNFNLFLYYVLLLKYVIFIYWFLILICFIFCFFLSFYILFFFFNLYFFCSIVLTVVIFFVFLPLIFFYNYIFVKSFYKQNRIRLLVFAKKCTNVKFSFLFLISLCKFFLNQRSKKLIYFSFLGGLITFNLNSIFLSNSLKSKKFSIFILCSFCIIKFYLYVYLFIYLLNYIYLFLFSYNFFLIFLFSIFLNLITCLLINYILLIFFFKYEPSKTRSFLYCCIIFPFKKLFFLFFEYFSSLNFNNFLFDLSNEFLLNKIKVFHKPNLLNIYEHLVILNRIKNEKIIIDINNFITKSKKNV